MSAFNERGQIWALGVNEKSTCITAQVSSILKAKTSIRAHTTNVEDKVLEIVILIWGDGVEACIVIKHSLRDT